MEQSPSWEANRFSASQKFPSFYGTRMFITAFTSVRHLSLSWASSIQSIPPHPTSCRSISILSSHLHVGLPIYFFPSGLPTKNSVYTSPLMLHAPPISFFSILNNIPHHHQLYYYPVFCVDRFSKVFYKGEVPGSNLGLWLRGFTQSLLIKSKIIPKLSHGHKKPQTRHQE